MVSDRYEECLKLQTRERTNETAKIVKSNLHSNSPSDELQNLEHIVMSLLMLLREHDNNQGVTPGVA